MAHNPTDSSGSLSPLLSFSVNPRLAIVFPGQGAQKPGMGKDIFEAFASARAVYGIADSALAEQISAMCFDGPDDLLTRTENAQPAILATSAAYLAAAIECGTLRERPAFVAGHSLGEYTALVAAGALDLHDAVTLVRRRGALMAEAGEELPGTMAAILGLGEATVERLCAESGAEPANYNGPTQVVVGGSQESVLRIIDRARENGGKAMALNVAGAFHTSLMSLASGKFGAELATAEIREASVPVVGNVDAESITSTDDIRAELQAQISRPVQWSKSITEMLDAGIDTFIELGPGRTLTGMLKRIAPGARAVNIDGIGALTATQHV